MSQDPNICTHQSTSLSIASISCTALTYYLLCSSRLTSAVIVLNNICLISASMAYNHLQEEYLACGYDTNITTIGDLFALPIS